MDTVNLGRDSSGRPLVVDRRTLDKLRLAEQRLGVRFTIVQGSWRAGQGAVASAGTHDRGGVVDLRTWDLPAHLSMTRVLTELRRAGLIAWYRTKAQGFDPHIHAVDNGNPDLASGAAAQVRAWANGLNGLASGGPDDGPRVPIPSAPPSWTREGAWNLRVGRRPKVVAGEVVALLRSEDLDFLMIHEAAAYTAEIRKAVKRMGYVVKIGGRPASKRDSAIVTRRKGGTVWSVSLGGIQWERKFGRPGLHPARHMTALARGRTRRGSVHMPPNGGRRQPQRERAQAAALTKLERVAKRWTRRGYRWVLAGDWNAKAHLEGAAIARRLGGDLTGSGIDYVISRGYHVADYRRGPKRGSDHAPILYSTHPKES